MDSKFDSQYFSVTNDSIKLLRNRFAYREIKSGEIQKIELTKGTDIKRPMVSMMFGILLLSTATYLILNFAGFESDLLYGGSKTAKAIGYSIAMVLFFFGLGGYAIYKSFPLHYVMKLTLTSGERESLGLDQVIKEKKIGLLLRSLEGMGVTNVAIDPKLRI